MKKNERLLSLDVLRGLDLFMLVGLQPVLRAALLTINNETLNNTLLAQLDHAPWEGFRAWDLVMPLFLFMSGVTMPFSLPKYLKQNSAMKLWKRVLKRFFILFALGILVQGNILSLNPDAVYLYSNTLQAIAVGYLLTVPLVLYLKPRTQIMVLIALLATYTVPMMLWGDDTPQGNFACEVDKFILGRFRDQSYVAADGSVIFAPWYDYTWVWSSLTFCCTVAMGSLAGTLIKNGEDNRKRTAITLLAVGASLVAAGLVWNMWQPMVKRIWNGSMTIYSGGLCYLLLAFFYWWIDVKGHRKGWEWLLYYGCNAITAYLIGEIINFRSVAASLLRGTEQYIGSDWYAVLLTTANSIILFFILRLLYKQKLFLKV
ncbi:MAG: DUF5009 domain-containing protein [Bacteroidaceae bacterium]|nr:DUF5009 domain-containing protein [Bacteroidaceae bacterium]